MKNQTNNPFGSQDLRSMAPNEEKTLLFPSGAARASFLVTAYREPALHPRKDVMRYKTHTHKVTDEGMYPLTVRAIPV